MKLPIRRLAVALAAVGLCAPSAQAAEPQLRTTWLSTPAPGAEVSAGANATPPKLSADGTVAVFAAAQPFLTSAAATGIQVYARDTRTGATELVSRASGADGAPGNARSGSGAPTISSGVEPAGYAVSDDGRYVVFESDATNLTSEDTGGRRHLYVRDRQTHTTTLVTRADGADGAPSTGMPQVSSTTDIRFALSGDGRHVAFDGASVDEELDPTAPPLNATAAAAPPVQGHRFAVHVRDLAANTTRVGSLSADGSEIGYGGYTSGGNTGRARTVGISRDGRYLFFSIGTTQTGNLGPVPEGWTTGYQIWRRDLRDGGPSIAVSIDADGAGVTQQATTLGARPLVSGDGRYVLLAHGSEIVRRDIQTGTTSAPLARNSAGEAPVNDAGDPVAAQARALSDDGQHVAFGVAAANFAPGISSAQTVWYVRDIEAGVTRPVSLTDGGAIATAPPGFPGTPRLTANFGIGGLSGDGSAVGFSTDATDLQTGSGRGESAGWHAYRRDLVVAPEATSGPAISGAATVGATLTASDGDWSGTAPLAYSRVWQRSDGDGWATIDGATEETYVPVAADLGHRLRVVVTVSNVAGEASEASEPTAAVREIGVPGGGLAWGFSSEIRTLFPVDPPNNFNTSFPGDPDQVFWYPFAGAERLDGVQEWRFPVASSAHGADGTWTAALTGGLRIGYCVGAFRPGPTPTQCPTAGPVASGIYVVFRDLELTIDGDTGTLSGVSWAGFHGTPPAPQLRRAFAALDFTDAAPVTTGDTITWAGVKTTLTAAGEPLGLGTYHAGTVLDPITITLPLAAGPEPTPTPTPTPTATPTATPIASVAPTPSPTPVPTATPEPPLGTASIARPSGVQRLDAKRRAKLATLTCPSGTRCTVRAPKRVRVRIAGRSYTLTVIAPKTIAAGRRATLRVQLPKAAATRLRGRRVTVSVRVSVKAGKRTTTRTLKVTLRARR